MKKLNIYILLFVSLLVFNGCDDFFEPNYTNDLTEEEAMDYSKDPEFILGLYVPAYSSLSSSYANFDKDFFDCATDNAVSNQTSENSYLLMSKTGYFTSKNYPVGGWTSKYKRIRDVYKFLSIGLDSSIVYLNSDINLIPGGKNEQLKGRMEGECYYLLALNYFQLLRDYGGYGTNGKLLGVPLVKKMIKAADVKDYPRASYVECVAFIDSLIEKAKVSGLKDEYSNISAAGLNTSIYGDEAIGIPTISACNALKSRLYLYAGSEAFVNSNEMNTACVEASKAVIETLGDLPDIYGNDDETLNTLYQDINGKELIMRKVTETNPAKATGWEKSNFPPVVSITQAGGRTNPSQNLVDAFGDAKGYPLALSSDVNELEPYENRDPRLKMFILYNGENFKGYTIETFNGGNCMPNGKDINEDNSTFTGYFLRKWMVSTPNLDSKTDQSVWHYCASFRLVEAYLNCAEAEYKLGNEDEAKKYLRAVRFRAHVPSTGNETVESDPYLNSCSGDALEALIHNERRIELCFEGHRFYDMRRWAGREENFMPIVKKVEISKVPGAGLFDPDKTIYTKKNAYPNQSILEPYMKYGAIPKSEIEKYEKQGATLIQNEGWK